MGGKYVSHVGELTKCLYVLFELRIFVVSNEVAVC
jgi:hypothetical protein